MPGWWAGVEQLSNRTASAYLRALLLTGARREEMAESLRLFSMIVSGLPLVLCGVLKIAYDLALLFSFRHIKPPEERGDS